MFSLGIPKGYWLSRTLSRGYNMPGAVPLLRCPSFPGVRIGSTAYRIVRSLFFMLRQSYYRGLPHSAALDGIRALSRSVLSSDCVTHR